MAALSALTDLKVTKRGLSGRAIAMELHYLDPMHQRHCVELIDQHRIRDALHEKFLYSSAFRVDVERDTDGLPKTHQPDGGGLGPRRRHVPDRGAGDGPQGVHLRADRETLLRGDRYPRVLLRKRRNVKTGERSFWRRDDRPARDRAISSRRHWMATTARTSRGREPRAAVRSFSPPATTSMPPAKGNLALSDAQRDGRLEKDRIHVRRWRRHVPPSRLMMVRRSTVPEEGTGGPPADPEMKLVHTVAHSLSHHGREQFPRLFVGHGCSDLNTKNGGLARLRGGQLKTLSRRFRPEKHGSAPARCFVFVYRNHYKQTAVTMPAQTAPSVPLLKWSLVLFVLAASVRVGWVVVRYRSPRKVGGTRVSGRGSVLGGGPVAGGPAGAGG